MKIQSEEIYFLKEQVADLQNQVASRQTSFITNRAFEIFQREIRNEIQSLAMQIRHNEATSSALGGQASFEGSRYQNEVSRDLTTQ